MNPFNYGYGPIYEDEQEENRTYDFLTPKEVMEELAIGKNTLYRLLNSGELPAFRIGKLWRVRKVDLESWTPNNSSFIPN